MSLPSKRRREAFNRAAQKLFDEALAERRQNDTDKSLAVEDEAVTSDSSEPDTQNQNVEPSSVPLYAKSAAYALVIPGGINFVNIEDATKQWESDNHLEQSDTDPLGICEDIKKEYIVKEEVKPTKKEHIVKEEVKPTNKEHIVKEEVKSTPDDQFPVLQNDKNLTSEKNSLGAYVGTFPTFHFLSGGASLKMAYNDMYSDSSQDFNEFASQFIDKSAGSSSDLVNDKPQVSEQNCDVKTSPTTADGELFSCAICSATFYHRRTIVAHMKDHFV